MLQIRRTYKYKMLPCKRQRHLYDSLNISGIIWNHALSLQKRYYRMYGGYISLNRIQKHVARLRKGTYWEKVGSQAVQDILERQDKAFKLFFKYHKAKQKARPPRFQKVRQYRSFTLKQSGWKYAGGNEIIIQKRKFKFYKSRNINGKIKTITIKRDTIGQLWLLFSVVEEVSPVSAKGKTTGYDFGLKTFLTSSDGEQIIAPEPLKNELDTLRKLSRAHSAKKRGSKNREKARVRLVKQHKRISNIREDFHFKLAIQILSANDHVFFETLNIQAMRKLWGRKVSDLGLYSFMEILKSQSKRYGCEVHQIGRWEPTSQTCYNCGKKQKLGLSQRLYSCSCGYEADRDVNAAKNIKRVGASTLGLEGVRLFDSDPCLSPESHTL